MAQQQKQGVGNNSSYPLSVTNLDNRGAAAPIPLTDQIPPNKDMANTNQPNVSIIENLRDGNVPVEIPTVQDFVPKLPARSLQNCGRNLYKILNKTEWIIFLIIGIFIIIPTLIFLIIFH